MSKLAAVLVTGLATFACADAFAGSAGRCGGTGGGNSKTLTCPSGQYIVGIGARAGLFVDQFSVACQKLPASGAPGTRGEFRSAGPGGGTKSKSDFCGKGHAVTMIRFSSGGFVDRIGAGFCSARDSDGWKPGSNEADSFARVGIGGPGGVECSLDCPVSEALYEVTVKSGGWIDSISGKCRK